jgi:hypothetical protein
VRTFFANYSGFLSYLCKTPSNQAIHHHFFYCSPVVVYAPSLKVITKEKTYRYKTVFRSAKTTWRMILVGARFSSGLLNTKRPSPSTITSINLEDG